MRGTDKRSGDLFSHVDLEKRVRMDHPLRTIREMTNTALAALLGNFAALYLEMGRPSIPPEKLLRARRTRRKTSTAATCRFSATNSSSASASPCASTS